MYGRLYTLSGRGIVLGNIPEERLCAGNVGTIVERHNVPGRETGYSVEFFDMLGNTVAVVMLPASARWAPPVLIAQQGVRNRRR